MSTVSTPILRPSPAFSSASGPSAFTPFLATALLAAGVVALVLAADRLLDGWAQSHLVAAWLALWAVAVLAIVLLRGLTRVLAQQLMTGLDAWSARLARRRADERLWAMAQKDPRLMRDLEVAMDRAPEVPSPWQGVQSLKTRRAARLLRDRLHCI